MHFAADLYLRKLDSVDSTLEERFRFYAGDRQLGEIVRKDGTDQTLYFHTDHLGSPDTISDSDGASFKEQFDPFGAPLDPPNPEITRVGFTGQDHDNDLGLIDMKGRIYDPLAGRFTTADPVMQAPFWSQGLNRYSYAFNNPVNNTDPSGFDVNGEDSTLAIMGWGGFTVGAAALSSSSFGAIAGGTGIAGLNIVTSLATNQYSLFDGSAGSVSHGAAPSAAPRGSGFNRGADGGAGREAKGGVGPAKARAPKGIGTNPNTPPETQLADPRRGQFRGISETPVDAVVRTLGQDIACAMGECKSLVDTTLAVARLVGPDELRALYSFLTQVQVMQASAAREVVIIPGKAARVGAPLSEEEAIGHVRHGGDVVARDQSTAKRIAEGAGSGPPQYDPPHGPGQKSHYHPTGVNGERVGGHVLF